MFNFSEIILKFYVNLIFVSNKQYKEINVFLFKLLYE